MAEEVAAVAVAGDVWTVEQVLAIRNRADVGYHQIMRYVDGADRDVPNPDAVVHPTHLPADPVTSGELSAVVFCAACGWLLTHAGGPAWGPHPYLPCQPVTDPAEPVEPAGCEHVWLDRGTPGDYWRECYLCGTQEDV